MSPPDHSQKLKTAAEAIARASKSIADSGLVSSSSGNLSVRLGDEMLITPRRGRLENIDPASCRRIMISDGTEVGEPGEQWMPSSESPLHLSV